MRHIGKLEAPSILEVPEVVVRRLCLRNLVVGFRLAGVNDVGKFHCILNKEDRDIVPNLRLVGIQSDLEGATNNVPIALLGVELDGKTAHVTDRVGAAAAPEHRGESHEDWRFTRRVGQDAGIGHLGGTLVKGELPESTGATGVNDALRNTLVVESGDRQQGSRSDDGGQTDGSSLGQTGPRAAWGPSCPR